MGELTLGQIHLACRNNLLSWQVLASVVSSQVTVTFPPLHEPLDRGNYGGGACQESRVKESQPSS